MGVIGVHPSFPKEDFLGTRVHFSGSGVIKRGAMAPETSAC